MCDSCVLFKGANVPQSRGSPKSLVFLSRRAFFVSTALARLGKMQAKACLEVFLLGGTEQVLKVALWYLSPTRPLRVACRPVAVALKAPLCLSLPRLNLWDLYTSHRLPVSSPSTE